jgi:hypothetical protein
MKLFFAQHHYQQYFLNNNKLINTISISQIYIFKRKQTYKYN